MMIRHATGLVLAVVMFALAGTASGQSLADVARREAERRGATPKPGKVYTNESLTPDFTTPPESLAPAPTEAAEAEAEPGESGDPLPEELAGAVPPRNERGEEYWRGRATRIRTKVEAQKAKIEALQQRLDTMAEQGGSTAARERELTSRMLAEARSDLTHLEAEWANFEATARSKNVPAEWIR